MANRVTAHGAAEGSLRMSNGLTDVVLDVLTLAGTALAISDHQRDLVVWLAAHDQAVFGRGCVGFDVADLPITHLTEDRAFLSSAAGAAARDQIGWASLSYEPHAEWLNDGLERFVSLLGVLTEEGRATVDAKWLAPSGYPICPSHSVLLHRFGCRVCNHESPGPPHPLG